MPATLPSSFASAAAGSAGDGSSRASTRADGGLYGDWARRPNGATQTFRRSSTATGPSSTGNTRESISGTSSAQPQSGNAYAAAYGNAPRNGLGLDMRYSKSQLLDLFKEQREVGDLDDIPPELFFGEVDLSINNGQTAAKWTRREDRTSEYPPGPEICWDREGTVEPLGLVDMDEEERDLFTTSVNSPLKGPGQTSTREAPQREVSGLRKSSVSQANTSGSPFGMTSPNATKPSGRRREASESFPFPKDAQASPSVTPKADTSAVTPPTSLFRRRTEFRDSGSGPFSEAKDGDNSDSPFSFSKRSVTGPLSAGLNPPSSPWSTTAQADTNSPMGAFGSFALGGRTPAEKRPGFGGARGESRFRNLMTKSALDEEGSDLKEKGSVGSLGKFRDQEMSSSALRTLEQPSEDAISGDDVASGNDAPGHDYGLPGSSQHHDDQILSSLGMSSETGTYASFAERQRGDRFQASAFQSMGQLGPDADEPMSPTYTNPYQSPQQHKSNLRELGSEELDAETFHLPGLGGFAEEQGSEHRQSPFSGQQMLNRAPGFDMRQPDRIQTSNAAAGRGLPGLSGLGGLPGLGSPGPWSSNQPSGIPGRDKGGFSDVFGEASIRSPGALQSPGLGGLGPGPTSRGGRIGSIFSNTMQEQVRTSEQGRQLKSDEDTDSAEDTSASYGSNLFSNSMAVGSGLRSDVDSPFRQGRGKFDDFFGAVDRPSKSDLNAQQSGQTSSPAQIASAMQQQHQSSFGASSYPQAPQQTTPRAGGLGTPGSGQPPAPQQKTMVMPDRIRWIYRDPQGNTQGPWSGLEMHDWYRAGFFSPELLVKKVEDPDYEPLAQLIRRIGNSREPFLVPQIGIPGPPSSQGGGWPNQSTTVSAPPPNAALSAQPPFAGSFPSFGTTLTAEQQNALERRKQEEQYLMARQKEHLAQQQVMVKQIQMQNQQGIHSAQLHHHSSAHSLHSQPSFGSVTSPNAFQNSPMPGSMGQNTTGAFDNTFRVGGSGGTGPLSSSMDAMGPSSQDDPARAFERLNLGRGGLGAPGNQGLSARPQFQEYGSTEQRAAAVLEDRAKLQADQLEEEQRQRQALEGEALGAERLQQFHSLRKDMADELADESLIHHGPHDFENEYEDSGPDATGRGLGDLSRFHLQEDMQVHDGSTTLPSQRRVPLGDGDMPSQRSALSLTEQVQKAASAHKPPNDAAQPLWSKGEALGAERPPQSASPLPAPAARRSRQNVADALAAESTSQSASPSIESAAASVAPWAKDPLDVQKQPSLKEIQEAEARRAARQEEIAAIARRAALEKELASQQPPPAPGLPLSSTWGSSESPVTPSGANASAWTKPPAGKPTAPQSGSTKKTIQQIQKEQEALARKQKAAAGNTAAAGAAASQAQAISAGKRYAELAGKTASSTPPAAGGSWTTVGAGGKAKAPPPQPGAAALKAAAVAPTVQPPPTARPKPTPSASSTNLANAQVTAQEEFKRWAIGELRPDLSKGIQVEDFVQGLLNFPSDTDVITEAVHSVSQTMDSRHFAEEFVRRRGLAEKGKTEPATSAATSATTQVQENKGGGWSEVARKGPVNTAQKDEGNAFKIVSKKKGSKR